MSSKKIKNVDLKNIFQDMSEFELTDYKLLSKFIYEKVGISLNVKYCGIKEPEKMLCWGGLKAKQYPDELAKLLVFLYRHKNIINSYCEIGPWNGGTFFVVDSFLRAINSKMGKSLAVDIRPTIFRSGFEEYKNKYSQVEFLLENSMNFKPDQYYDFCFIDGCHKYDYVKHDYENMKNYSKILAFHDIKIVNKSYMGVCKFWEELHENNKIELINEDQRFPMPVGIGVVINE